MGREERSSDMYLKEAEITAGRYNSNVHRPTVAF